MSRKYIKKCPDCGSTDVIPIAYGMPGEKLQKDADEKSDLARLREDLAIELTSPMGSVTYPKNLTWGNYVDYICCPTLCYELEYPRTDGFVWSQLGYKVLAVFGVIFLLKGSRISVKLESSLKMNILVVYASRSLM